MKLRGGLVGLLILTICAANAAEACGWRLKAGRAPPRGGGILCKAGQLEFQVATLACENAPLRLDLEGDCGLNKADCRVRFTIDGRDFDIVGTNHPVRQLWDGYIAIPLTERDDLVNALAAARLIEVRVEDRPSWRMPTEGLAGTLAALAESCAPETS